MELKALVESLRGIADFYEAHPDFPLPFANDLTVYAGHSPDMAKQQVATFLDGAGHVGKESNSDDYISLIRFMEFPNGLPFQLRVRKEYLGCRKVAHERVILEEKWECGPILDAIAEVKEAQWTRR